ncbi:MULTISPECIES: LysR family transcriptional regulator [Rhizobium]|uniref:DNA-binding transcriptional LysR family regulator n=1 Tax=Rhizobium tropici TaxID=398 RepID=A0A6P1BYT3_RHITR|nr:MULTISPECIES: LysR family transcriptional regulator [Rhizobium]AGB71889.1 transcriptional regulator, LysR family [Rhizobium tropici CIAT 899]MBB4243785.1 DNA-binding transcriptional LysR family regulator [Rhizobium tropici]MBB5593240.1 DNA-binding transcriptional LysR family regulator [Rhizobium tropici]MBB6494125.1 DNA-binding transcriptional LysR family regulator [Rhizobium tropici]NEV09819.1 LysR family transcriptional regulator [Rhizobium tropici]
MTGVAEPSWDFYRTFLAVLEHGSLSAAARELGLTQPTVGRHILALEQSVGAELFTRSQQGLLPTDAAMVLKPYAETLASTAAALLRAASGSKDKVSGTVRISASEVIGAEVLPPILAKLQARYPDLIVELSASDTVEDLLQREADIAVRMVAPAQEALLARHIGVISLGLFAHRSYIERYGKPETVGDLRRHKLIGFDRQTAYIRMMTKRYPVLEGISFSFRSDHSIALHNALRAGIGIGFLQIPLASRDPALVQLLPEIKVEIDTWIVMHENLKTSPRCRVTFDALVMGLLDYIKENNVENGS